MTVHSHEVPWMQTRVMEQRTCADCGRELLSTLDTCNACGWSNALHGRRCLKCNGPILLMTSEPEGPVAPLFELAHATSSYIAYVIMGFGALALRAGWAFLIVSAVFAAASILMLWSGKNAAFRCQQCSTPSDESRLVPIEKQDLLGMRLRCLVGGAVCGVMALGGFWLGFSA